MSKQREEILKIINESEQHLTAEEIFFKCKENNFDISIATVYRNLGILLKNNIINKVIVSGEPDRFDKSIIVHEHIYCDKCKKVKDIQVNDLKDVLEEKTGYKIISYDLCLHYMCPDCQNNDNDKQ